MAVLLSAKACQIAISRSTAKIPEPAGAKKIQIRSREASLSRRSVLLSSAAAAAAIIAVDRRLMAPLARAEDKPSSRDEDDDAGVIGAVKSLFDPDEKTKSGKVLPKAYLRSARDVVKNLRESLTKDTKSDAAFRRVADAAKESIRDYLGNWRGNQAVAKEESYVVLEKAIRSLAGFYSKAGPSASLPEDVKSEILNYLNLADESL